MITLRLDNIYGQVLTTNDNIKHKLWEAMRFREDGYWHVAAFKQGRWDGYTDFFNKSKGQFLAGLRPEIEYALKYKFKEPYIIDDQTGGFKFQHDSVDKHFLDGWLPGGKNIELYDYQVDLINQSIKYKRGIVKAPTGSGKTAIFAGIVKALPPNTPTLVLTDTINLTEQNYDVLKECNFENVGLLHGSKKTPNIITCSTTQSVKKLEKLFPRIKALIVDEVHACMSKVPMSVYRKLKNTPVRIGISATPFKNARTDKFKVRGYFGPVFKTKATDTGELTTQALQKRGILSGSECVFFEIDEPQLPYEIFQDAVKFGLAENHHLHEIIKKLTIKLKGRTLILVERLTQGTTLNQIIPGSYWIQGEDKVDVRKEVISKLRTSENVVAIVSQKIISKGLDVKIHNLINAAGGKAEHSIIQRMGRGLRTADDKGVLKYYDFLFNINDYLRDHSEQRINTLRSEGHPIAIKYPE